MDSNMVAVLGALALLVRFGHTLHTMGAVRARSVAAVAARALVGTASIVLLTWFAGHLMSWLFDQRNTVRVEGPGVFFATPGSFLSILALTLLPAALVGGSTAERARLRGLFVVVAALTVIGLPLFAGLGLYVRSSFVGQDWLPLEGLTLTWPLIVGHVVAATGALTLAKVIGARAGKYNRDGSANFIPAHSLPTMVTGDLLLVLGIPMMAAALTGDPAARVVNSVLAASAATLAAVVVCQVRDRRVEVLQPWHAALAGIVCGSLSAPEHQWAAIAVGALAGAILPILSIKTDLRFRIDETSGLALPHLVGGVVGAIGASLDVVGDPGGSIGSVASVVGIGLFATLVVVVGSAVLTAIPALLALRIGWLRVDEAAELEGLDLAQHDINAYPDFQQTLIKSYHLRQ